MKALSLTILMVLGLAAQAHVSNSQPSDLTQYWNHKYTILDKTTKQEGIPNKGVKTKYGTVYTKLQNVCKEGGMVKTIQPVRMCAEWGYKLVRCKDGAFEGQMKCYDRDERVCNKYAKVHGEGAVKSQKKTCANLWDKESAEWRRRNFGSDTKFKTDFPNCSVFKYFTSTMKLSYNFLIISNLLPGTDYEESQFGGPIVDEVNYTVPHCSSL